MRPSPIWRNGKLKYLVAISILCNKGLFATTGSFTRDAIKEASRDGATPIDLLDGEALTNKIKELNLGLARELAS
jgi:restriction endonuclease Mrr